jgi:preprotein translocase SecE subunit
MREKASKATDTRPKHRVIKSTASKLRVPLSVVAPLAKPFQTKPAKKVGRVVGFILWPPFVRGAWGELRQVNWPSRRETWKLTLAVFVFAFVFGTLIAITDYGLDKLFKKIILN